MKNLARIVVVAAAVALSSGFLFQAARRLDPAPAPAAPAEAKPAEARAAEEKKIEAKPAPAKPAPEQKAAAKPPAAAAKSPARPGGSAVRHRWEVVRPPRLTGKASDYDDYVVRDVVLDPSGDRVLTRTRKEIAYRDARTGTRLQTFPADPKKFFFVSPDARFVASVTKDGKEVTLFRAATGERVGTYRTPRGQERNPEKYTPTFTPGGDFFLFCVREKKLDRICAMSTRNAAVRFLNVKREWDRDDYEWKVLLPLPREGAFLRQTFHMGVWRTDLKTGREHKINTVDFEPSLWQDAVGVKVSPDGRYLSARQQSQLKVIDWRSDRSLIKDRSTPRFDNEWFTPDGKRIAVLRTTDIIYIVNDEQRTPTGGWLQLYDIATGAKLAEFIMDSHGLDGLSALAFHRDGRSFVMADKTCHVAVVDFERAFRVKPLPPAPAPERAESLPLH